MWYDIDHTDFSMPFSDIRHYTSDDGEKSISDYSVPSQL